ncbi:MAG: hypothetical protein RI894_881 [Bacteroidota bacterium]|jgi:hypothetical protein
MKRAGHLIEKIADLDNLYLAFWKAKRGKTAKPEVLQFEKNFDENMRLLQTDLLNGDVPVGDYHYFTIHDPKERQICASSFRERVVQHALMNVCHAYFETYQIAHSYACRKGKGTYAAIEKAVYFSKKYTYFAKLDVRKYFETIDHVLLKQALLRQYKDPKLICIFFDIIDSYQTNRENGRSKGIPIGNLTSQYFANHYLAQADHYAIEVLQVKAYVRYMDDMVLWSSSLADLRQKVAKFIQYLETTLGCCMKQTVQNSVAKGLPFLGYVIHPARLALAQRSKRRFIRKLRQLDTALEKGQYSEAECLRRGLPLFAFLQKANTYNLRKKACQ